MARGVEIDVKGLNQLIKKFGKIPENVKREVEVEMVVVGEAFVARATVEAPQDIRYLANHITLKKKGDMRFEVVSPAPYSAYVEFGTKSRFKAIPGVDASKFRGKGKGDYYDFLNNILDWVKRKGIASRFSVKTRKRLNSKADKERLLQTAQAIAYSIIKHGIHPHPFFFKQLPIARAELMKAIKPAIDKALNK